MESTAKEQTQLSQCHAAALACLARRDFTAAELLERLCRKWPRAIAQATLEQMRAAGWVDDKKYASRKAASLTRNKAVSMEWIQARLCADGVPEAIAEKSARSAAATLDQVCAQARRMERSGKSASSIARALSRAGFDADTIESAFAKARIPWSNDS